MTTARQAHRENQGAQRPLHTALALLFFFVASDVAAEDPVAVLDFTPWMGATGAHGATRVPLSSGSESFPSIVQQVSDHRDDRPSGA